MMIFSSHRETKTRKTSTKQFLWQGIQNIFCAFGRMNLIMLLK